MLEYTYLTSRSNKNVFGPEWPHTEVWFHLVQLPKHCIQYYWSSSKLFLGYDLWSVLSLFWIQFETFIVSFGLAGKKKNMLRKHILCYVQTNMTKSLLFLLYDCSWLNKTEPELYLFHCTPSSLLQWVWTGKKTLHVNIDKFFIRVQWFTANTFLFFLNLSIEHFQLEVYRPYSGKYKNNVLL